MNQLELAYRIAKTQIGVKEIPGENAENQIIRYHKTCTLQATSDEIAWCSSFVNWCFTIAGTIINPSLMIDRMRAAGINGEIISTIVEQAGKIKCEINNEPKYFLEPLVIENTGKFVVLGTRNAMARSWLGFGSEVKSPMPGDLVIYHRGSDGISGHVGFIHKVGAFFIDTLGGNQNNSVSISPYARMRVLGYRRLK